MIRSIQNIFASKKNCCVICKKYKCYSKLGSNEYRVDEDGHVWHVQCLIESFLNDKEYNIELSIITNDDNLKLSMDDFARYGFILNKTILQNNEEYSQAFSKIVEIHKQQELEDLYDSF